MMSHGDTGDFKTDDDDWRNEDYTPRFNGMITVFFVVATFQ